MNILHYSLGFPPFRTGGMTKYCIDLMKEQIRMGNNVSLLWPGAFSLLNNKTSVKRHGKYLIGDKAYCRNFELVNPLPVPLLEGINDVQYFTEKKGMASLKRFFDSVAIDVIHLHTIMGLPIEILKIARSRNIKIVFTTHDFYGLCPKCNFMFGNIGCPDIEKCSYCKACNKGALSINKIKILQSGLYRKVKSTPLVKKLRKGHIIQLMDKYNTEQVDESLIDNDAALEYLKLREFYIQLLSLCDVIHCNSTVTCGLYSRFIAPSRKICTIPITNSAVKDKRVRKVYEKKVLNIGYLGPQSVRKGFFSLLKCLDRVYYERKDFNLIVYNSFSDREYIQAHDPYNYSDIERVMQGIDVLVVPSVCQETFGFTVLEALSCGVPVVVSMNVGAKDLVTDGVNGSIYDTETDFIDIIQKFLDDHSVLENMNRYICNNMHIKLMREHAEEIMELYIHG